MVRAFIGIGANLGEREKTLGRAVDQLDASSDIRVVNRSKLHETEPVGVTDQPRFLNGVVEVDTVLEPRALLERLLQIETKLGRVRGPKWGPRTIDLDLLWYEDRTIDETDLRVPHPRMHEREFVLAPLAEIDADLAERMRGAQ